jgi:hypothetical protein
MRLLNSRRHLLVGLMLTGVALMGFNCGGLNIWAYIELSESGVDKYLGEFTPVVSTDVGDGWTKHTFDPDGGNGPICIAGTPFSVFTRAGSSKDLLIFEQGGGACWQDFYNCNVLSEDQEPPAAPVGIWDFASADNPFADHSVVYMPYCDGSVFTGDNDVFDPSWQAYIEGALGLPPGAGPPLRFHRGMRNQSAGMDVAGATFPHARNITVSGSSAGGVGAAGFAPFLVRYVYGNHVNLTVFNDAGPVTTNLDATDDIAARAADWQFGQFYPASCTECDDMGQSTAIIKWRLDKDTTIREAFYETDADQTNRFFLDLLFDPAGFRELIVTEHGLLNAAHPNRYKRFIVAGDTSHTALQTPLFNTQDANGVVLSDWTADFLASSPSWRTRSRNGRTGAHAETSRSADSKESADPWRVTSDLEHGVAAVDSCDANVVG